MPELGGEAGIAVRDDGLGETVEGDDAVQKQLGKLLCRDDGDGGNEMAHLGEAVDNGEDRIVTAISGKRRDEVHADVRPALLGNGQGLEQASRELIRALK